MTETLLNPSEQLSDKESTTSLSTVRTKPPRLMPKSPGRPVGSKNKITQQKIGIESQLRDQLGEYMPEVLQKAIELALKGDRVMLKLLLEMTMSKAVAVEDTAEGRDKVQVTIRRLNIDQAELTLPNSEPKIIDVTPIVEINKDVEG
jgi:hypothetical protein